MSTGGLAGAWLSITENALINTGDAHSNVCRDVCPGVCRGVYRDAYGHAYGHACFSMACGGRVSPGNNEYDPDIY